MATSVSRDDGKPKGSREAPSAPVLTATAANGQRPLIEWTGERCLPWADDLAMVYEHYHRYLFAAALASGRRVLDLGSGEGYGSAILATQATEVVGVEIDKKTVEHARASYRLANLSFLHGDVLDLSELESRSFDLVTCFETIEHLDDHEGVLAEVLRVLRPEGVLLVSTPDRISYSVEQGRENPFHVHEVSQDELMSLLSGAFPHVRLWSQNAAVGSVIAPIGQERGLGEVVTLSHEQGGWTPGVKLNSTYLLAMASRVELAELPGYSTLVDVGLELVRRNENALDDVRVELAAVHEQARVAGQEREAARSEAARQEEIARAAAVELEAARAELTHLAELAREGEMARAAVVELDAARAELALLAETSLLTEEELRSARASLVALEQLAAERDALAARLQRLNDSLGVQLRQLTEAVGAKDRELAEVRAEGARLLEEQALLYRDLAADHDEALRTLQHLRHHAGRLEERQDTLLAELHKLRGSTSPAVAELAEIKGSVLYPLLDQYQRAINHYAPAGTRRRAGYQRVVGRALRAAERRRPAQEEEGIPPLRTVSNPEVSIVIPVYNNWELTVACLRSLAFDNSAVRYEVIVVDDCSTDVSRDYLPKVVGLRLIQLERNSGFIGAVNAGLQAATGRFVLLLNNDTVVEPGWLDALMRTVEVEENVGVVGAKLVYPDGVLQEAGGIIWRDGTGMNYGRGGDADDPAFNFMRDVDYCSGACLLVRKEIFDVLGGLDRRYAPAYYEDTDLAFAARKLGYRVVYQPEARICHREGASNGTDESAGVKRYQKVSREAFRLKWEKELLAQYESSPDNQRLASSRPQAGRVLLVSDRIPMPDQDSGSKRMFEFLLALRDLGLAVTFVPFDGVHKEPYTRALQRAGVEVLYGPLDQRKLLRDLGPGLDLAILSRPEPTWQWQPLVRELCPDTKIIYDTVDLHFVRETRRAEIEADANVARAAARYREMELSLARIADATLVVSQTERQVLAEELPGVPVHVVPNIHGEEHTGRPFDERKGILFVGSFPHHPNRDAVHWLVEEIMPLVRQEDPDIIAYIVGSSPTEDIMALASENVRILGWVPDLANLYEHSRLSVAPLRYGAGVKGKVGESMAHGVPVVTTRLGAEGMGLEHEHDVLVADGAEGFAKEILRAYRDPVLWAKIARNARRTIARDSSPYAIRCSLAKILEGIGVKVRMPDTSRSLFARNGSPAGN